MLSERGLFNVFSRLGFRFILLNVYEMCQIAVWLDLLKEFIEINCN